VVLLLIKYFYPDDIRGYTFRKKKVIILTLISYGIVFFNALKYFFNEKFIEKIKKMNFKNIDESEESDFRSWEAVMAFWCISFLQLFVIWVPKILR
jgi:menaquinone-dependent protoporphyrinogen IX oxidase